MANAQLVGFERLARPLLELIQRLTGLETSFVTQIDWASQTQEVVFAMNTSELQVAEGSVVDWSDSMCRWAFLSGKEQSSDVSTDFPGSVGGDQLGMRSFLALPILSGDTTLGTVCGASRRTVQLEPHVVESIRLISKALSFQMASHVESEALLARAERAEALALVDPLTGLANRRAFTSRLEEELARSGRHDAPIALLAIDLDKFKSVNDTYGHAGGDVVLVTASDVLRRAARSEDVPARLGGDEFALLLAHCDAAGVQAVATRIVEQFGQAASGINMPCTLSIGTSTSDTSPRRSLLADADKALYRSKAKGGGHTQAWAVHA